MWRVFVFLFVVFPCVAFAECVSVDRVTKCARLPTGFRMIYVEGGGTIQIVRGQ